MFVEWFSQKMVGPFFISNCIRYNHLCPAWSLAKPLGPM
jgi:hypothetical protein